MDAASIGQIVVGGDLDQRQIQRCQDLPADLPRHVGQADGQILPAAEQQPAQAGAQAGQRVAGPRAAVDHHLAPMQALQGHEERRPGIGDGAGRAHRDQDDPVGAFRRGQGAQVAAVVDDDGKAPQAAANAATPGSSLPSMNSRNAPPAVEM